MAPALAVFALAPGDLDRWARAGVALRRGRAAAAAAVLDAARPRVRRRHPAVGFSSSAITVTPADPADLRTQEFCKSADLEKPPIIDGLTAGGSRARQAAALALAARLSEAAPARDPADFAERWNDELGALLRPGLKPTPGKVRRLARLAWRWSTRIGGRRGPGVWHDQRARSVAIDRIEVLSECGKKSAIIHCGCQVRYSPIRCKQREACPYCASRANKRNLKRLIKAFGSSERWAKTLAPRGFRFPRRGRGVWQLITLSVSSLEKDGSPRSEADQRQAIVNEGFPRLRSYIQKFTGRSWPFAWVQEGTAGNVEGTGHLHIHVAWCLPFIPVQELAEEWVRATKGKADLSGFDLATRKPTDADKSDGAGSCKDAARYIAKYASKGIDLQGEGAARYWAATYGKRRISTSKEFWVLDDPLRCPDCGEGLHYQGSCDTPSPDGEDLYKTGPPADGQPPDSD